MLEPKSIFFSILPFNFSNKTKLFFTQYIQTNLINFLAQKTLLIVVQRLRKQVFLCNRKTFFPPSRTASRDIRFPLTSDLRHRLIKIIMRGYSTPTWQFSAIPRRKRVISRKFRFLPKGEKKVKHRDERVAHFWHCHGRGSERRESSLGEVQLSVHAPQRQQLPRATEIYVFARISGQTTQQFAKCGNSASHC